MSYLRDNPAFEHVILLQRDDALWLLPGDAGRWTLPTFASDEQHTAEVELVVRHVRERHGVRMAILGTVSSDFDEAVNRVRRTYLAEPLTEKLGPGRFWPREAIAAGEAPLDDEVRELVARWATGSLGAGDMAWSRPGWLAGALAWVSAQAGPLAGAEQVRVSESSTVLRIVAGGRSLYFKAVAPSAGREVPLTAALGRRSVRVPSVLAADTARRFLLMEAFAGEPLATSDLAVWEAVARAIGELQRSWLGAAGELQELGCEVAPATSLVEPLLALLADADALLVGDPAGLAEEEVAALRALAPGMIAEARALDAGPLPRTLDHGDLWPSNVLVGPGRCAFVDWEDARIAHPFFTLFQLLAGAHLEHRFADEPAAYVAIREAYLRGWNGFGPLQLLRQAFDAAHDISAVGVASSYRRTPPAVVAAHPWIREMPAFCLRRVLARRALGEATGP